MMKIKKYASVAMAGIMTASLLTSSAFALDLEVRDGQSSETCFTYETDNKAWAHLINPYNKVSLYNPPNAKMIADDTKDLIVQFTVSGVQEEFTVFPGFQVYGDDEEAGEELSIWSQSDYEEVAGSEYTYKIDQDGSYELVIPFRALADGAVDQGSIDFWGDNLDKVGIIELCFSNVGNDDMTGFKHEGFSVEFTGIVESNVSRSVAECAFNGGEPVKFYDESQSGAGEEQTDEPADTDAPDGQEENTADTADNNAATEGEAVNTTAQAGSSSSSGSNPAVIIIIVCVCVVVIAAVVVIVVKKKKN